MDDWFFGGVELGGTNTRCAISDKNGSIVYQTEIKTTTPEETLNRITEFFQGSPRVVAVGVGCFGPLDLNPVSDTFGYVLNTPKHGWENTDVKGLLEEKLGLPTVIDTDVNCAAIGEYFFGAAKAQPNFIYMTVGTGIGATAMAQGKIVRGQTHSEMGHIMIPHDTFQDPFGGTCPFHGNCFEGLASGESIEKRVGKKGETVIDYRRWDLEALYLALGIYNLVAIFAPKAVVLGGGVIQHGGLVEQVTEKLKNLAKSYVAVPKITIATDNNTVKGAIKIATDKHGKKSDQDKI